MVKNPTIVTKTETSLKSTKFVTKISQIQYTYGHLNRANINNSFGCAGATLFALFRRHLVVHEVRLGCNLEGFLIKQDTTEMFLDNSQLNKCYVCHLRKKRNQAVGLLCLNNELSRYFYKWDRVSTFSCLNIAALLAVLLYYRPWTWKDQTHR